MRILGVSFSQIWSYTWLRIPLYVLGSISLCLAIWFGLVWTGVGFLMSVWLRTGLITLILGSILSVALLKYRKRRLAASDIEESLIETPVGDGAVLADRMQEALAKLKKSGGSTYLYDLPWYVIIGPPGAGKTTALMHSGLEFPGTSKESVAGFGGTKNCDFWFSEEAVLIDTAGRYTTQDSDERADRVSWQSFLEQLKRTRTNQPINGVILAFSCEDMMIATDSELDNHALIVRKRLEELHEKLRIDVPVYVIFTKADKIAGFREYFGPFGEERRRSVWGVTFQTKNRKDDTYKAVPAEFDALISRLSDEVTDRLNEEPDSVARISIFGLPGQMALLQGNVSEFLRRVFQKPQETHAILRGFYFTSGTQEGTPIDQVLGTVANQGTDAFQAGFMSGKGRSYFLHDLLKKVIFAERDWVGYDLRAMRIKAIFRTLASAAIVVACFTAMGIFGYSFWKNATLVREAGSKATAYAQLVQAQPELSANIISDANPLPLVDALAILRDLPAGWSDPREQGFLERAGLSRRNGVRQASLKAYSDALEQHLRPRMMLFLETKLPELIAARKIERAYHALKVYILLAKQQPGKPDDTAIMAFFADAWLPYFEETGQSDEYEETNDHLAAMLFLDDRITPSLKPNTAIVEAVQRELATLPLAQQAFSAIKTDTSSITPFELMRELEGVQTDVVFRTTDQQPLETLTVPGLFTFSGYWATFRDQLDSAEARLEEDSWVLGKAGQQVDYAGQLAGLERDLHLLYKVEFTEAWEAMLDRIELMPMSTGAPQFPSLSVASVDFASPILKLAEAVDRETRLSRFLDQMDEMEITPEALASGDVSGSLANAGFSEIERRSGAFQRIALNLLKDKSKFQGKAGSGASSGPLQRRQLEDIERKFEKWHKFVKGDQATRNRPVNILLAGLQQVLTNRQGAARSPNPALDERGLQDALGGVTQNIPFYPEPIIRFVNQIEREFLTISADKNMSELERALDESISSFCKQNVETAFPFASGGRHISSAVFGEFFGNHGRMSEFYETFLRDHTQRDGNGGIVPREGSSLGARLSAANLKQFARAERIRQAFFPPNSPRPVVKFSIRQLTGSATVEGSLISFGERQVQLLPNSTAVNVTWPDEISDIVVTVLPQSSQGSNSIRFSGGRWSILHLIQKGRGRAKGTRVDVSHSIGGRSVTFRLEFDSITVPFLMKELKHFKCPTSLE
jgi:type VI secretion system protein ImpL